MSNLKIEYRPLDALIPYANNSRTHSEEQVAQIAASIDWLQEAGYLTCQHRNAGYLSRVHFAAKGLEVLKSVPESMQEKKCWVILLLNKSNEVVMM